MNKEKSKTNKAQGGVQNGDAEEDGGKLLKGQEVKKPRTWTKTPFTMFVLKNAVRGTPAAQLLLLPSYVDNMTDS